MNLCVCLLTYAANGERSKYAQMTLQSVIKNLSVGQRWTLHIADDGSHEGHVRKLYDIAFASGRFDQITSTDSARGGYGANVNLATQMTHVEADYVLMLEDDWELVRPFDMRPILDDMENHDYFNCVRLGYLAYTQNLFGLVTVTESGRHYLLLLPDSPEPHVWAGHPRIERVSYQRKVGPWYEGLSPGETEFAMAHLPQVRQGVYWPMDLVKPYGDTFAHIGTVRSY